MYLSTRSGNPTCTADLDHGHHRRMPPSFPAPRSLVPPRPRARLGKSPTWSWLNIGHSKNWVDHHFSMFKMPSWSKFEAPPSCIRWGEVWELSVYHWILVHLDTKHPREIDSHSNEDHTNRNRDAHKHWQRLLEREGHIFNLFCDSDCFILISAS